MCISAMNHATSRRTKNFLLPQILILMPMGLVPAIGRGTLPLRMAGTKPGHDGKSWDGRGWFHPGRVGQRPVWKSQ